MAWALVLVLYLAERHWTGVFAEQRLYRYIVEHRSANPSVSGSDQFFAGMGTWPIAVAISGITAVIAGREVSPAAAIFVVVSAGGAVGLAGVFSDAVQPTRLWLLVAGPQGANGFPSGHVAYATGAFASLALVGWRAGRRDIGAVCVLLIGGMCFARTADTSHLPSDVVGALFLGMGWVAIVDGVLRSRRLLR